MLVEVNVFDEEGEFYDSYLLEVDSVESIEKEVEALLDERRDRPYNYSYELEIIAEEPDQQEPEYPVQAGETIEDLSF